MGVPSQYIKDAPIDWRLEFMQAARQPLRFGSACIQPPTFGVWALLELCDCDYVHPHKDATAFGGVMAAYIAATGLPCVPFVNEYLQAENKPETLEDAAAVNCPLMSRAVAWALSVDAKPEDYARLADWLFIGFSGFAMIPGDEGGSGECIFGLEALGGMIAGVGDSLGCDWESVMWDTPLVVIGHAVAQSAKQAGTKGVARPKDKEHMREMFDLEKQRKAEGKLMPWQEEAPLVYGELGHESPDELYRLAELVCKAQEAKRNG